MLYSSVLHGSARTTPRLRAEFQASLESTRSLASRYGGVKEVDIFEADRDRHRFIEVPLLGRELGKVVCSAVQASADHAS